MNYCSHCGSPVTLGVPPGDDRTRHICQNCDRVHYQNPRIIAGAIPVHEQKILLCRRAIAPREGLWTLPAGFLENGETIEQGALRESLEEANARLRAPALYAIFDIPRIHQVYIFFRAELADLDFAPGTESLETALFAEADIPWEHLAFTVVDRILRLYLEDRRKAEFPVRTGAVA